MESKELYNSGLGFSWPHRRCGLQWTEHHPLHQSVVRSNPRHRVGTYPLLHIYATVRGRLSGVSRHYLWRRTTDPPKGPGNTPGKGREIRFSPVKCDILRISRERPSNSFYTLGRDPPRSGMSRVPGCYHQRQPEVGDIITTTSQANSTLHFISRALRIYPSQGLSPNVESDIVNSPSGGAFKARLTKP